MGANTSRESGKSTTQSMHHTHQKIEDLVDLGSILPNGLYPSTEQDFDSRSVRNLIMTRKLAPFYKGLSDAPEPVADSLSVPVPQTSLSLVDSTTRPRSVSNSSRTRSGGPTTTRPRSASSSKRELANVAKERQKLTMERMKQRERMLYNDAVECPICFLYYPSNTNYSRCCDQPICTECFVQIKRPVDTPSTPATCPFCMEENYGVTYEPPAWSDRQSAQQRPLQNNPSTGTRHTTSGGGEGARPRRQCISHTRPEVVLVDHVRPDWQQKLVVPAKTARTVSRRNSASAGPSSRNFLRTAAALTRPGRSASSAASTEHNQYLSNMRDLNMDLEEWMVVEAIRLSLLEETDRAAKAAAEAEAEATAAEATATTTTTTATATEGLPAGRGEESGTEAVRAPPTTTSESSTSTNPPPVPPSVTIQAHDDDDDDDKPLVQCTQAPVVIVTEDRHERDERQSCDPDSRAIY
ncbi:hypothetical protein F4703DRAFT_1890529 [Phycomyces blakesleeanus]